MHAYKKIKQSRKLQGFVQLKGQEAHKHKLESLQLRKQETSNQNMTRQVREEERGKAS